LKKAESKPSAPKVPTGNLGTFSGVFTPSILTILGIILFLRLGYVVGNAGLGRALLIIGVANAISILTTLSLSAVATNLKVKVGGPYYIISRTLGPEYGGSIGVVLFLAQSVSIGFYCIGFGEALADILPYNSEILPQIIALFSVAFLLIFAWLGADWGTRFHYVVMTILALALMSFFIGGLTRWDSTSLADNWAASASAPGFWVLFAIFFPAVTGFTQGVSMSGDLRDAGKSIPLGTFLAVGISILVYFVSAILFASALPGQALANDYGAMKEVALLGSLINAGVFAATLSSAMASFLGAPRILQSLSEDRIFPFLLPFAKGYGAYGNPRRGVLLSGGIALATIAMGDLNVIAPVVSMFFLVSYGLLNYATYYEARASSPSFRPTFRWFDARLSLLGFLACLAVMLAINPAAGAVAVAVLFAVYQYLSRTAAPSRWADSRRSFHLQRIRQDLFAAAAEPEHPRDWRPQLLAFSDHSHRRERLLRFASWLEGGSGLTTAVRILEGQGAKMVKLKTEAEAELRQDIEGLDLNVFPLVAVAPTLQGGIYNLVQTYGIGPLRANTILLNWLDKLPQGILGIGEARYARELRTAFRLGCNIVVLDARDDEWATLEALHSHERRIDVWWLGDATSRLMLLLAYLMTRSEPWSEGKIRLLAAQDEQESEFIMEVLRKTLQEVRIEAEPRVVERAETDAFVELSEDSSLVFVPFRLKGNKLIGPFGSTPEKTLDRLPIVAMVLAGEDIDLDAEPEEGKAGEIATALDALADAESKARDAQKEADKFAKAAEESLQDLESSIASGKGEEIMPRVQAALETREEADKAARRAAKAAAKLEDARREAQKCGAKPDGDKAKPAEASQEANPKKDSIVPES
jgi:amino acid transporter